MGLAVWHHFAIRVHTMTLALLIVIFIPIIHGETIFISLIEIKLIIATQAFLKLFF